jgi:hypothetical protein
MRTKIGTVNYQDRVLYLWLVKESWHDKPELQFTYRYNGMWHDSSLLQVISSEVGFHNRLKTSYRFGSFRKFWLVLDNVNLPSLLKEIRQREIFELTKTDDEIRDIIILEALR